MQREVADGRPSRQEAQLHEHGDSDGHAAARLDQLTRGRRRCRRWRARRRRAAPAPPARSRRGAPRAWPRRTPARRRRRASRAAACRPCGPGRSRCRAPAPPGAARMKPRASMPTTLSTTVAPDSSRPAAASASMTAVKPAWSASSGVMSLKTTPGSGKSGTSTTRRSSASRAASVMPGSSPGHLRLERGCRVGCCRPDAGLWPTGRCVVGTVRPRPVTSGVELGCGACASCSSRSS